VPPTHGVGNAGHCANEHQHPNKHAHNDDAHLLDLQQRGQKWLAQLPLNPALSEFAYTWLAMLNSASSATFISFMSR
jgi:hypothetical protein